MADDLDLSSTPWNGNEYTPFTELMEVEKLDDWTYQSIKKPFSPAASTAAFGGHPFAQAVYAASKTVAEGMVICVCMSVCIANASIWSFEVTILLPSR